MRYAGVIPTPGVAWLARELGAAAGVVVSASHNPYPDNGIKLLDPAGLQVERRGRGGAGARRLPSRPLRRPAAGAGPRARSGAARALPGPSGRHRPRRAAARRAQVVLDAGNGAASTLRRRAVRAARAPGSPCSTPSPTAATSTQGCGSTAPARWRARVVAEGARPRRRLRRRRRPLHPGRRAGRGARRRRHPLSLGDRACADRGRSSRREDRGHLDEQPRARAGARPARGSASSAATWATATWSRRCAARGSSWAASSPATSSTSRLTEHRRRPADRPPDGRHRRRAGRPLSEMLRRLPALSADPAERPRARRRPTSRPCPPWPQAARSVEDRLGDDGRLVLRYSGTEPLARIMIEGPEQGASTPWPRRSPWRSRPTWGARPAP